jgi:hypothetical protein
MKHWPHGISPSKEMYIACPNGMVLAFANSEVSPEGTDYVRIVNKDGGEVVYWVCDEWSESPQEVMGAILGAMVGEHNGEANYYRFAEDVTFPKGIRVGEYITKR